MYILNLVITEIYEFQKIFPADEEKRVRAAGLLGGTTKIVSDFIIKMIEYALTLNISTHTLNNYSEIIFYLIVGYSGQNISSIIEASLYHLHPSVPQNAIVDLLKVLRDGVIYSLKPANKEKFQSNFCEFLKKFKEYLAKSTQRF